MTEVVIDPAATGGAGEQVADPKQGGADKAAVVDTKVVDTGAKAADVGKKADGAGTLLDSDESADKPVAAPADWPEDWREKLAGTDDKFLAQLKRYASPASYAKAGYEAQQKIRSGEVKKTLPADAKPEDVAAWRKENGIPEKPEDYEIKLASGVVPGEVDKPLIDSFRKFVHEKNLAPTQFNEMLDWYYTEQEQALVRQKTDDEAFKRESEDALRQEWGSDFRPNLNAVRSFLSGTASEDLANRLLGARMADGRMFGSDPEALRWIVAIAREQNPGGHLLPSGVKDAAKGISDRIDEIRKIRRENPDAYDQDKKLQAEELNLIEARQKHQARGKAA